MSEKHKQIHRLERENRKLEREIERLRTLARIEANERQVLVVKANDATARGDRLARSLRMVVEGLIATAKLAGRFEIDGERLLDIGKALGKEEGR